MSATTEGRQTAATDRHAGYQKGRLFFVSSLALVTAGVAASLRSNIAADLQQIFFDPIDKAHSAAMIAGVLGVPFLGFALTIALSSPLLDVIGMGLFLPLSALLLVGGTSIMIFAQNLQGMFGGIEMTLWLGALVAGLGWGMVETVINPLIATLYPDEKTAKLNALHAWWPGGNVIGGLLGVFLSGYLNWQGKLALVAIPGIAVILLSIGVAYPPTERKAAGISAGEMFRELANPIFVVLFCSMFLTAASELAPGQWMDLALTRTVHMHGILLLVYVSTLMFAMRFFAGPLVHKLSPIGLLWFSCLLASIGLVALSVANSPITGLLAATVWGTGVCYMWPTMLATSSERFPRGGALLMGLMGTAGMLSIQFVLPMMGQVFDTKKVEYAGGPAAFAALPADSSQLDHVLGMAAQTSFRYVAVLPAFLLIVFGAIWLYDRSRGGFKAQKIS
jgi:MFS family permease